MFREMFVKFITIFHSFIPQFIKDMDTISLFKEWGYVATERVALSKFTTYDIFMWILFGGGLIMFILFMYSAFILLIWHYHPTVYMNYNKFGERTELPYHGVCQGHGELIDSIKDKAMVLLVFRSIVGKALDVEFDREVKEKIDF